VSADTLAMWTVFAMVPVWTTFTILYGFFSPWRHTIAGWAVFISSTGLTLLIDISAVYNILGDDYPFRDFVRQAVFTFILIGGCLKLGGWIYLRKTAAKELREHPHF
jgi:hypothetical protein